MRTAYIVDGSDNVVAKIETELKDGASVRFAYDICREQIDQSKEYNLVNAHWGEIKSGAKWWKKAEKMGDALGGASEINPNEFLVTVITSDDYDYAY